MVGARLPVFMGVTFILSLGVKKKKCSGSRMCFVDVAQTTLDWGRTTKQNWMAEQFGIFEKENEKKKK